ncbi:unnamed protein product [Phyllotreta striolata]|uniref:Choline transporter-like protein n=1 Tax=Phyllotreta striolata TaxID=444603 RepID=A0A9N9TUB1_PHYSR|nr:unnamed protein product [Phyllotreta striolata]
MAEKKHGEPIPYDPDFNGPLRKRSCTDVLCLSVFICFIAAWIGIGFYAILNGDPSMLLVPRDSMGRRCGKDADVLEKPYLFFQDLTECLKPTTPFSGCPTPQICVKECPNMFYTTKDNSTEQIKPYCVDENIHGKCPKWILPSKPFLFRCLYDVADRKKSHNPRISRIREDEITRLLANLGIEVAIKTFTEDENALQTGQNIVEDIIVSWWKILIGVGVALVICLLYITILRWLAAPMVWLSIVGVIVGLGAALYFTVIEYISARKAYNDIGKQYEEDKYGYEGTSLKTKRDLWLGGLIIISIVLGIILLVMIFLRSRISLAIALIKEGSKAVSSVTASLCFPIVPWILQFGVIAYAIAVGIYLASSGRPMYKTRYVDDLCSARINIADNVECDPKSWQQMVQSHTDFATYCPKANCKFIRMNNDLLYPYLQAYNIFGFFWLAFFVSALGQMVLAAIFAQWYWTFNKATLPFFAVTSAFLRTLRYHIGTLAFGSLIIAVCRMIRVALEYLDHKLKQYDNELTRAIMCIFKCFFYCLEKFLKFLNKNAYIMCAVHGKNFCASAKSAFMLLMRNILRVWVLDKVTDFLFFLSKVTLTLGVGAVSYVFFVSDLLPSKIIDNSNLHYGVVPVVIIMICTYLISSLFFSVYTTAVDTLFLCFLEDCERNDGSPEKPYYMSKNLMKIFGKKNKMD